MKDLKKNRHIVFRIAQPQLLVQNASLSAICRTWTDISLALRSGGASGPPEHAAGRPATLP
jgi:hypothetical protein